MVAVPFRQMIPLPRPQPQHRAMQLEAFVPRQIRRAQGVARPVRMVGVRLGLDGENAGARCASAEAELDRVDLDGGVEDADAEQRQKVVVVECDVVDVDPHDVGGVGAGFWSCCRGWS